MAEPTDSVPTDAVDPDGTAATTNPEMTDGTTHSAHDLEALIDKKAMRKLRARRSHRILWFGLGMFGMIGWSVAVPILLAIALGLWVDRRWPSPYSWTLMLLFCGVVLGCLNAWYWIQRERRLIVPDSDSGQYDSRTVGR